MASADDLSATSTFTLALPESVSVMPSLADGTAVTAIEPAAEGVEAPVAVAYAGPTPSANPLAATSTAAAAPVVKAAVQTELKAQPAVLEAKATAEPGTEGTGREAVERLIVQYAALYEVPVDLVRRVVRRESNFFPGAYNNGHWGLMQIKHATARGMGYRGAAKGLLDAETNLKYAVKYLRGAFLVADGNHDLAVRYYARGYYYDAKRKGLLGETGLGTDRRRRRI
jgi:soluble lytic murein transglycosylase-like protein